jgi:hypothetical protein
MRFLTPAEHRLLATLPADEARVLRELFTLTNARLIDDEPEPARVPIVLTQDALFQEGTRP